MIRFQAIGIPSILHFDIGLVAGITLGDWVRFHVLPFQQLRYN